MDSSLVDCSSSTIQMSVVNISDKPKLMKEDDVLAKLSSNLRHV